MPALTTMELTAIESCVAAPMLDQVTSWAAINSGSRHLAGLKRVAADLADAFTALPGTVALKDAAPVETMGADGSLAPVAHGQNLHVTVRPEAPVQLLFTGHM